MIFKKWLLSYRRRKALRNIRSGMMSLGFSVSHLSDEQIEAALIDTSKRLARAGVTADVFVRAFQRFSDAAKGLARGVAG